MTTVLLAPDGVPISATAFRQGQSPLYGGGANRPLGGRSGFRVDTASTVVTATSTTWTLKPCSLMIDPKATTNQGMYGWINDANITGAVTASDVTNARKDILYLRVDDSTSGDGSGAVGTAVVYVAGTPAATPVEPTLPARSFLLATITVPKTGAGSPTVAVNPARFVASGAALPVTLAERDALSLYDTLTVLRKDVAGRPTETYDGGTWHRQAASVVSTTATSDGFFTITGGLVKTATEGLTQVTATLRMVRGTGTLTINPTDSTMVLGLIPAGFRPPVQAQFVASVNNEIGARYAEPILIINSAGTMVGRSNSGGPISIATGYTIYISASWFI